MILVGEKNENLYETVKIYLECVILDEHESLKEFDVEDFYEKTKYPLKYNTEPQTIYIVPHYIESENGYWDISYSYLAVIDNIFRNDIKFREKYVVGETFFSGQNGSDDQLSGSFDSAFWKRIKTENIKNEYIHSIKEIKNCADERFKDYYLDFSH
jgi:hypothetical protein